MRARPAMLLALASAAVTAACSGRSAVHCAPSAHRASFTMSFLDPTASAPTLVDFSCETTVRLTDTAGNIVAHEYDFSADGTSDAGSYALVTLPGTTPSVGSFPIGVSGTSDVGFLPPPLPGASLLTAGACIVQGSTSAGSIAVTSVTSSGATGTFQLGGLCAPFSGSVTQVLGSFSLK